MKQEYKELEKINRERRIEWDEKEKEYLEEKRNMEQEVQEVKSLLEWEKEKREQLRKGKEHER